MTPISISRFLRAYSSLAGRVSYDFGTKAPLDANPHSIKRIDCSGFARWIAYQATGGKLVIPDGSWNQRDWCEEQCLKRLKDYADVQYAAEDGSRLFICFVRPIYVGRTLIKAGHVWYVYKGRTYESWGGPGVDSRPWNQKFARLRKAEAYELPTTA